MFKLSVKGMNQFRREFASAKAEVKEVVSAEIQSAAADFVAGARRDVPVDQGALKGSISFFMRDELTSEVVAQKFYAPFIEFGTKGKYKAIPGTEHIAAQFKGYKGGDFQDLLRIIVRWVKRKGITGTYSVKTRKRTGGSKRQSAEDYAAAWPIALSILKNGIRPQPYFFKQQEVVWPRMISAIERQLKSQSKVSVILPGELRKPVIV